MRVFVIAGEPSGDNLGGAVMAGLRELAPGTTFDGVGGPVMAAQGLESRFPMAELSVMGIAEILPRYLHLKRRIRELADAVIATNPDLLLTIDSPDFCLRVARAVRARANIPASHYVAPSVWAWRPGRARRMAPFIDHVLALLPFEPPLMRAAGMECDFVGHPVATMPVATRAEAAAFRARRGLGDAPLVLALPGSRRGEIARLAPRFGQALAQVVAARPEARLVLPVAAAVRHEVRAAVAGWPVAPILVDPDDGPGDKRAAFAAADVALAASGTVSLELAANDVPMVIGYDMAPLSRLVIGRMLRTDTVTLVNLVSETRAVPEFIGRACLPGPMADALLAVLAAPQAQRAAMAVTVERLGRGGDPPGLRAARVLRARHEALHP
ncbi:MAG: lipid-A-disaccharide synthase [Rubellimicrobium sp.]|nr:lipid-A-disaccharide synthase [Rubellimicrobium sp.]